MMDIVNKKDFDTLMDLIDARDVFGDWSEEYERLDVQVEAQRQRIENNKDTKNCIVFNPRNFAKYALMVNVMRINEENINKICTEEFIKEADRVLTETFLNICTDQMTFIFEEEKNEK